MVEQNEYRGSDALVRIEGEELVFIKGGRLKRAIADPTAWRISIASIRELVFKDSKLTGGLLHLVIGDAPAPKATLWSAIDKPWTIQFQAGVQAKRIRELRDYLQSCIDQSAAQGRDPLSARRPYVDQAGAEGFDAVKQRLIGDTLVVAPMPEATAQDFIARAKTMPQYSQSWTDLDSLAERLHPGEQMSLLAAGLSGLSQTLFALTDRRLILHSDGAMSRKHDEMPRAGLQASWNSALLGGGLTFWAGSREITVKALTDATAQPFVAALGGEDEEGQPDVLRQLEKLGSLHRAGVLTDDEFASKKAELLGRL